MIEPNEETILRLTAYLDGEMSEQERAQLEADALADPSLAELLADATAAKDVVAQLPEVQAPDDFPLAVERRIRRRSQGRFYAGQQIRQRDSSFLFVLIALGILVAWTIISRPGNLALLLNAEQTEQQQPTPDDSAPTLPRDEDTNNGSGASPADDLPPQPESAAERRSIRPGAPLSPIPDAPATTANPTRQAIQWTLTLRPDLAADPVAAERALVDRVGRSNLEQVAPGQWQIVGGSENAAQWLPAIDELGQVSRTSVPVTDTHDNPPLRVITGGD